MRRAVWAVVAVTSTFIGADARDADERALLRVEARLCAAWASGDAAGLQRDLDATFTLTDSRGAVTDFARNVDEVARRDPRYDEFRNLDQRVRIYGDAAVITGITRVKVAAGPVSDAFAADFQYTDTWIRRAGHWTLVASHASRRTP
jgi:hypothetical protein